MKISPALARFGDTVLMPVFLVGIYAAFVLTSGAQGAARVLSLAFLIFVLLMWFGFRRLKTHAQASRLAGVGDPDGLLALVGRELPKCLTEAGRRPLRLQAAVAHNLRGDFTAARREIDASGLLTPRGRRGRGWIALAAATDVTTRSEQGDLAGARASLAMLAPFTAIAPFGGMELVARECEARVKLLEGDPAAARELLAPLVKNIRLSDATRAQVHALLARAAADLGEADVAADHATKARALAPHCRLVPDTLGPPPAELPVAVATSKPAAPPT